jgi:hypothetical protein
LSRQRATDTRARSRAFVEGEREGQDFAEAANEVLGNVLPSSGTSERLAAGLGVTGLGSYFAPATLIPNALIGVMNAPGVRDVLPKLFAGKLPKMIEDLGPNRLGQKAAIEKLMKEIIKKKDDIL